MSETTYKSKLHEPILNPIQVILLLTVIVFETVVSILPLLLGLDINPIWVVVTMAGGIIAFAVTSLLRAAYPEEVVDTRITTAFKMFIKQIVDLLFANPEDKSDLKSLLERVMVWAVREWDLVYQEELADAIEYAKSKLNGTLDVDEVADIEAKLIAVEKELEEKENG